MNKKDERIKKLWMRGVHDIEVIAKKIGYTGDALIEGITRVREGLERLNLIPKGQK